MCMPWDSRLVRGFDHHEVEPAPLPSPPGFALASPQSRPALLSTLTSRDPLIPGHPPNAARINPGSFRVGSPRHEKKL